MECRHRRSKRGPAHRPCRTSRKRTRPETWRAAIPPHDVFGQIGVSWPSHCFRIERRHFDGPPDHPPRLRARQVLVGHGRMNPYGATAGSGRHGRSHRTPVAVAESAERSSRMEPLHHGCVLSSCYRPVWREFSFRRGW